MMMSRAEVGDDDASDWKGTCMQSLFHKWGVACWRAVCDLETGVNWWL